MQEINILFTCAGRRNYLINYFKEALGTHGKIIAVDNQTSAPAMLDADIAIQVPSIYEENYIETLKTIIVAHKVNAVISLNDLELPILSKNRAELESTGARVLISNPHTIDISFDKLKTYHFFKKNGIKTPKTYISVSGVLNEIEQGNLQYPLIVKPRWGSASIGIDIVENEEELLLSKKLQEIKLKKSILFNASKDDLEESIIIQEKLNGDEYGMDILNDFNGKPYGCFVRKKLSMRSGETDKAVSIISEKFSDLGKKIGLKTEHIGNMDCDFFVVDGEVYFLEMNPRFGGGYPFSHEAGINTPAIYLAWLQGDPNIDAHNKYKAGISFSKYDCLMKISEQEN